MIYGNFKAGRTIAVIVALSLALVLATMIVPSLPSGRQTSAGLAALGTLYFGLIGLGFTFIEIELSNAYRFSSAILSTVLQLGCSA